AHPHAHALRRELRDESIGDRSGERLEQPVARSLADREHDVTHTPVIDGRLDRVLPRLRYLECDVDEERLTVAPLLSVDAVAPEELESVNLDDHPATAAATVRASTCSRTSCTRRIVAPRS